MIRVILKKRKQRMQCIFIVLVVCAMLPFLIFWFSSYNQLTKTGSYTFLLDDAIKQHVERSIQDDENYEVCESFAPLSLLPNFRTSPKLFNCDRNSSNWVTCVKSNCSVNYSLIRNMIDNVVCNFSDIIWENDFEFRYGPSTQTSHFYILRMSDFVYVHCTNIRAAGNLKEWSSVLAGVRDVGDGMRDINLNSQTASALNQTGTNMTRPPETNRLNILIMSLDNLGRHDFQRKMRRTHEFLTCRLGAVVFKGFNTLGNDRSKAFFPILTGKAEYEQTLIQDLPNIGHSRTLDDIGPIWELFQKEGYIAAFNEDTADSGTFTSRGLGFEFQPTDHYLRTMFLAAAKAGVNVNKKCFGERSRHMVLLQYTKEIMRKYKNRPTFIVDIHSDLFDGSRSLAETIDWDIFSWLKYHYENNEMDRTVLIVMSDRGRRPRENEINLETKLEERRPFLSISVPPVFQKLYPKEYSFLKKNSDSLTTPYDLYETLLDLRSFKRERRTSKRGRSLFRRFPPTRSCADAYIESHWCGCLWSKSLPANQAFNAARAIIETINSMTKGARNLCHELYVYTVVKATTLTPQKNVLKFKEIIDRDGYYADLTSRMTIVHGSIQIIIKVLPGEASFIGNVSHYVHEGVMTASNANITKLEPFKGNGSSCHKDIDQNIIEYCYCK